MKNQLRSLLLFALSISALTSCTVTKRQYQPGFYFKWNQSSGSIAKQVTVTPKEKNVESIAYVAIASQSQEVDLPSEIEITRVVLDTIPPSSDKKPVDKNEVVNEAKEAKRKQMLKGAEDIAVLHHFKQILCAAGVLGTAVGASLIFTYTTVAISFGTGILILLAIAGLITLICFTISKEVRRFKRDFAEFQNEAEYQKTLSIRRKAKTTLYIMAGIGGFVLFFLVFIAMALGGLMS